MRLSFFAAAAAMLSVSLSAHANPLFTFNFSPALYTSGSAGETVFTASILNIGTTDITGYAGASVQFDRTYLTGIKFGSPSETLAAELLGIDLKPAQSFSFAYATIDYAGVPLGVYSPLLISGLTLSDSTGVTSEQATNEPAITVAATPEPSSFVLLGTGLVGMFGVARRKFHKT